LKKPSVFCDGKLFDWGRVQEIRVSLTVLPDRRMLEVSGPYQPSEARKWNISAARRRKRKAVGPAKAATARLKRYRL